VRIYYVTVSCCGRDGKVTSLASLSFLNHKGGNTKEKKRKSLLASFSICENVVFIKMMERGYLIMSKLLQSHRVPSSVRSLKENLFTYLLFEGELVTSFSLGGVWFC